jgi:hypothetical protein
MKCFLILVIISTFISCSNPSKKKDRPVSIQIDSVYNFAQTSDSKFCNKDSILPTDYGFGTLYLTKNGNAIYNYYCIGSDTTIYCIGTYAMNDSVITCHYTQDYLYADCTECQQADSTYKIQKPENGILRKEDHDKVQLIRANCKNFDFYILPTEKQKEKSKQELKQAKEIGYTLIPFRGYVYWKATPEESKAFRSFIKKIPALRNL